MFLKIKKNIFKIRRSKVTDYAALSNLRTYLPELCYSGAGWLSGVGTYLPGTVLQWCRLFKQCQNLPAGYCVTGVQSV